MYDLVVNKTMEGAMQFQDALSDITVKLKQGRFPNEQSISQGHCALNNRSKMALVRAAAEVGGLTFGQDLIVDFY